MYRENIFLYDVTQITTNLNGHHSSEILDVKKNVEKKKIQDFSFIVTLRIFPKMRYLW